MVCVPRVGIITAINHIHIAANRRVSHVGIRPTLCATVTTWLSCWPNNHGKVFVVFVLASGGNVCRRPPTSGAHAHNKGTKQRDPEHNCNDDENDLEIGEVVVVIIARSSSTAAALIKRAR